ncbi:MAG: fructose-6-phosphate aldolase [Candidatus Nitrosocaldaceae archaeon]
MKIFLDTANLQLIKEYNEMGLVDGITTNPTLLAKENNDPIEIMKEIVRLVKGPVSLEVVSQDYEGMIDEAHRLKKFGENVVVKIPMTSNGLKAIRRLKEDHIDTNCTLVFSSNQAILAAKSGARYVSPFIGRLDDAGHKGMNLIKEIVEIFKNYNFDTEVIVASVRHPLHVISAARIGADIVTLPPDVLAKMLKHPLTDKGLDTFNSDWEKVKKTYPNLIL